MTGPKPRQLDLLKAPCWNTEPLAGLDPPPPPTQTARRERVTENGREGKRETGRGGQKETERRGGNAGERE